MTTPRSLNHLWNSAAPAGRGFDPAQIGGFPAPAQRYLQHAIEAGTPISSAVRLRMHGEIRLKAWYPFSAEEVIAWDRGFIWQAAVRIWGVTIRGGDYLVDGNGGMRWNLFGLIPFINARGLDISRSAAGRVNIESIWLPSVLCGSGVWWSAADESHLHASFAAHGENAEIDYTIDRDGHLTSIKMPRFGNPDGGKFGYFDCGGLVDEERRLGGYTIPVRMRVGWHFGSPKFEREGEFFRVTIDEAAYR
jgi:uncharacterized protein DUF6920